MRKRKRKKEAREWRGEKGGSKKEREVKGGNKSAEEEMGDECKNDSWRVKEFIGHDEVKL